MDVKNPKLVASIRSGSPCVVIGDGKSGTDALNLLKKHGATAFGFTNNSQTTSLGFTAADHDLESFLQNHTQFQTPKLAVLSPGIPLTHPYCRHLQAHSIPIVSEVELGLAFCPTQTRLLGVTGTNGKSTVTDATSTLLNRTGRSSTACGNIGLTVSGIAASGTWPDVAVVELSSYQLETMQHPVFDAAVFINLTPDHLARYGTLEAYFRAKWRITHLLKPGSTLAVNQSVLKTCAQWIDTWPRDVPITKIANARLRSDSRSEEHNRTATNAFELTGSSGFLTYHRTSDALTLVAARAGNTEKPRSIHIEHPHLRGEHNAENLAFVYWLASQICPVDGVFEGFCSKSGSPYTGLSHRLEDCTPSTNPWGAQIINDSKSTSFICTAQALRAFEDRERLKNQAPYVVLLAGGQLKEHEIAPMFENVDLRILKAAVTFGPEAAWLAQAIRSFTGLAENAVHPEPLWQDAVREGIKRLARGDTLLFSPGAASFDAFKNFEERGEHFIIMVKQLASDSSGAWLGHAPARASTP